MADPYDWASALTGHGIQAARQLPDLWGQEWLRGRVHDFRLHGSALVAVQGLRGRLAGRSSPVGRAEAWASRTPANGSSRPTQPQQGELTGRFLQQSIQGLLKVRVAAQNFLPGPRSLGGPASRPLLQALTPQTV